MSDTQKNRSRESDRSPGTGTLVVVGLGPGGREHRTYAVVAAIQNADVVVGYTAYLKDIADLTAGIEIYSTGMRQETERVAQAIAWAQEGKHVVLVSSGDAGIYGMAGLAYEMAGENPKFEITVLPGVTAASAAAAALGAPLMLDFAVMSLSDLLVPWTQICKRLEGLAAAGLVTVLYNPKSRKRVTQLSEALAIFSRHRGPETLVGIVTYAGCPGQTVTLCTLATAASQEVDMHSVVVVANEHARLINGKLIVPRGYSVRE